MRFSCLTESLKPAEVELEEGNNTQDRRLGNAEKGPNRMMHFTCDQCGKGMRAAGDARYEIKIQIQSAHDPSALTEGDLDEDHMETLSELLSEMEAGLESHDLPPARQELRFDLCPECHDKYVRDPLGREQSQNLRFSQN